MAKATTKQHYDGSSFNAESIIVVTTCALALYNAVELLTLIFVTFQRFAGLYFWSLLLASIAVIPYTLGYLIMYFLLGPAALGLSINNIGWVVLVTGQSFVLYSRLHLIVNDKRIMNLVLAMIIVDAIIFHIPQIFLVFFSNFGSHPGPALDGYNIYEKVQMTGFCIQEFIISGIYIWKTIKLLNIVPDKEAKFAMWQLFSINVLIVVMDIALLVVEYCDLQVYEQVFKAVIYSVKLKLEYAILGKLVSIVKNDKQTLSDVFKGNDNPSDYVDQSRSDSFAVLYPAQSVSPSSATRRPKRSSTQEAFTEHHEIVQRDSEKESPPTVKEQDASLPRSNSHQGTEHRLSTISSSESQTGSNLTLGTSSSSSGPEADDDLYAEAMRQMTR